MPSSNVFRFISQGLGWLSLRSHVHEILQVGSSQSAAHHNTLAATATILRRRNTLLTQLASSGLHLAAQEITERLQRPPQTVRMIRKSSRSCGKCLASGTPRRMCRVKLFFPSFHSRHSLFLRKESRSITHCSTLATHCCFTARCATLGVFCRDASTTYSTALDRHE